MNNYPIDHTENITPNTTPNTPFTHMKMNSHDIEEISYGLSNHTYHGNYKATKELIELFNRISKRPLTTTENYIDMYDFNFYTYHTWEALVQSEIDQNNGMTEEECKEQVNKTIWQLPCGWFVQYV